MSSKSYINEEQVLHNEDDDMLLNTKLNNNFNNFEEENLNTDTYTKDEDLVNRFMSRVHEIYNDFFMRIDIKDWKALLEDQSFWILSIQESLCYNMMEFLMNNYYIPHNVWCLLNDYFSWTENEDYLYKEFNDNFINYVIGQVNDPQNLRYEFFKKDHKCDYDEFITLRIDAHNALIYNNLEDCEKALMSAMELFSDDPDLVRMLGIYYLRIEDSENAKQAFSHLIKINPKEIDGYLNRGYILIRQGKIKDAYYDFQNALNIIPDNISALKGLAECYFYFDNLIEAKLLYGEISETCAFDVESRLRIVEINAKLIDKYKSELSNNKSINTTYELAKIYFEMEAFEECHKTIKDLVKNEDVNSEIYLLLGRTLAGMNSNEESLEYFNKALIAATSEKTNAYEILSYRGLVNFELDNYEGAINDFKANLKINKYDAEALHSLSEAYLSLEEYSKTVEYSSKAINIDPSKWIYYSTRGLANFYLKNYEESRNDHAVVLRHEFSFSQAWYRKGYCHLQLSQYEEAIECFKEAIDWKDDTYEDIHLRLALAYFKFEDLQNALTEVKFHFESNPRDYYGFILMGDIYRAIGNSLEAEKAYINAFENLNYMINDYKNDENLYVDFMWLCSELNKFAPAIDTFREYERLLERNKNIKANPYVLFYYSVVLYKGFNNSMLYKRAAKKLEEAIKLGLRNGDLLSYLSLIYYDLGNQENSIKYAKEALAIEPSNQDFKTRYEGIMQYGGKRNFFILKTRPSSKKAWPSISPLERQL